MSARLASQEQSSKFTALRTVYTIDYVLVYWSEEDCVSVVATRNVVVRAHGSRQVSKSRTLSTCCYVRIRLWLPAYIYSIHTNTYVRV